MATHQVVIGVTGGVAELLKGDDEVNVIILDFDHIDEYGTASEQVVIGQLLDSGAYEEVSQLLQDWDSDFMDRIQ